MRTEKLPSHLKKYTVEQSDSQYSAIEQAEWRYILRQLKSYLSEHAHSSYVDGLGKTGITLEHIPSIASISHHLAEFGWSAVPVSGFIPPSIFMEMQSLGILPIARNMRTMQHLKYTPAPDIVHEAAGHAPMLANFEYASYLRKYADVAQKAILSIDDLHLYNAIRILSDIKEDPSASADDILSAQNELNLCSKKLTKVSEAGKLSRMNWWTAEYGLIGKISNPKIFGAGLLSSVGESKWCLSDRVKKIPLSINCIEQSYDITEPQPQLYVAEDFSHLATVLDEFSQTMSYRRGGASGINTAIEAQTVCTAVLDTKIEISGVWQQALFDSSQRLIFIRTAGPTQLALGGVELRGHGQSAHREGFSCPLAKEATTASGAKFLLSDLPESKLGPLQLVKDSQIKLQFDSGMSLTGIIKSVQVHRGRVQSIVFRSAELLGPKGEMLFQKDWGQFDWFLGNEVTSVYGGAADRALFSESVSFPAHRVPTLDSSPEHLLLDSLYSELRSLREDVVSEGSSTRAQNSLARLSSIYNRLLENYPQDWLLRLEIHELLVDKISSDTINTQVLKELRHLAQQNTEIGELIIEGLAGIKNSLPQRVRST